MKVQFVRQTLSTVEADAVVLIAFEGDGKPKGGLAELNSGNGGWVDEVRASGEFHGKMLETAMLHRPKGLKAKRCVLIGGGDAKVFGPAQMRKLVGALARKLKTHSMAHAALFLDGALATEDLAQAATEGSILGNWEPTVHKSDKKDVRFLASFTVSTAKGNLAAPVERGSIVATSQNFTRDLVNEPANLLTPMVLAKRAQEMAAEEGLECEVLDRERMEQLGMGSLLGVSMGSSQPPALIVVRYRPAKAKSKDHLALVGKGVTFDTGGVSIKPADGMEKMKYDMAGGAAVLGAMKALAKLKPSIAVTAFVPAVENMCSHNAQRPGDIVTAMSGKTIEVLNTDAEGRLILADAMEYARRQGCTHMVDAATLTGAVVVALGHVHIGAFSNNDEMFDRVAKASKGQGEKMWRMPLDDEYKEYLKSPFADLGNIGGRWGGACTAAYFLKEFACDTPWVHLDIAGTAWLDETKPDMPKGPTGVCVRTFIDLALGW